MIALELENIIFQVLNMDGNYIKELSKNSFSSVGLLHLQKISMKDCKIQKIDENAFSKLKILAEINLDGNNISKLPPKLFDGNERLQSIVLSNNKISMLIANQFPPLRGLKKIDISNGELKTVNARSFTNLGSSVETINLNGNKLENIRPETFVKLTGLKVTGVIPTNNESGSPEITQIAIIRGVIKTWRATFVTLLA